jgi:formate hydrogenlyase subunit 6/NADH:ubiquinone oxidoreductase subunit I
MIEIESNKCDFCGCCVGVCPVDCIDLFEAEITIDMEICIDCKLCVYVCPIEVLDYVEKEKI